MREWTRRLPNGVCAIVQAREGLPSAAIIFFNGGTAVVNVRRGEEELFQEAVRFFERGSWAIGPWPLMLLAYKLAAIVARDRGTRVEVARWADDLGVQKPFEGRTEVLIHVR